ncbi:MAG: glycosyltransferase [Patescibacteria group bacterium]|jgi:glycosyltransferase involved in cell wall biosynthesis
MPRKSKQLLSVIIPAYLQEKTIVSDLKQVSQVLEKIRYNWEIIVVVDGCVDKTYQNARKVATAKIKVFKFKTNHGKGYAVRFGMKKAKGDYILFLDSGMEIDPNGISMLLEHLEWYDADIIVGSKRHPVSVVNYPLERVILSAGYYWMVRILFGINIKDTQPGIKIFRRSVLTKVLPLLQVKRYAFDIEMLSVAHKLGFTRIFEAPIKLDFQYASLTNASTLKAIWGMFWDTLRVFYRLKILDFYGKT